MMNKTVRNFNVSEVVDIDCRLFHLPRQGNWQETGDMIGEKGEREEKRENQSK